MNNRRIALLMALVMVLLLSVPAAAEEAEEAESGQEAECVADDTETSEEEVLITEESDRSIVIRVEGRGRVSEKEGRLEAMPDDGCELVSVTADSPAGSVSAGCQIPEEGLQTEDISSGATVTFIFREITEDSMPAGAPLSSRAVFG